MSAIDVRLLAPPSSTSGNYLASTHASFERVPSLDGLRAVSILLVLMSHYVDGRLFPGGLGVLVFFVVSGFLIARLMLAEQKNTGHVSLLNFYLRRFFRLYPVVTIYTAVVILFCFYIGHPLDLCEPASALFYFANYVYAWSPTACHAGATAMPFGIFWSLSVEEHFYLFFPLLFVLARGRRLASWMTAICIGCLALRLLFAQLHPEWLKSHFFYFTDVRLDSIAFGVLLAAICEKADARRMIATLEHPLAVMAAVITVLLCLMIRNDWFRETLRYTLLGAAIAVIVAAIVFSQRYAPAQAVLNWAVMRWIGMLSYSIYVWHSLLPLLLHRFAPALPQSAVVPADFALTLAVAALSYFSIERPASTLRHHFGSRTAT